jgi:hypothetical protein
MLEQMVPDLAGEVDVDLVDMQDYKFRVGEQVDYYLKKQDRVNIMHIELVLDEMIQVKNY